MTLSSIEHVGEIFPDLSVAQYMTDVLPVGTVSPCEGPLILVMFGC